MTGWVNGGRDSAVSAVCFNAEGGRRGKKEEKAMVVHVLNSG